MKKKIEKEKKVDKQIYKIKNLSKKVPKNNSH